MSDNTDNGGPAFPRDRIQTQEGGMIISDGMTLRDYFAAKALPVAWEAYDKGYTSYESEDVTTGITEHAYQLADAMLRARGEA